jgi:hypothetical protein
MANETLGKSCVVLFSGGTDSTCAAALCAERFSKVHLLTFYERSTRRSPVPLENVARLRKKYGEDRFIHRVISTDALVRKLSFENYFANLMRHGFLLLSTPGFSSLSWHLRTITYCQEHGIHTVFDGMTQELVHLPGHMPAVRAHFAKLYAANSIEFSSPVMGWEVPPDQRFVDRLIVDRHGFAASAELQRPTRTTGTWLYENGVFPRANVKGSLFDHRMQHDCYPFVVFNMLAFWLYGAFQTPESFAVKEADFFAEKVETASQWLRSRNYANLFAPEKAPL